MKATLLSIIAIAALTAAGVVLSGCGAYKGVKASDPTKNPVNTFESYANQVLLDTQAGLAETDKKIKSGELPQSLIPDYDRAAVLYNTAIAALKRYDAAMRSSDPTASAETLQNEIQGDLADLISLAVKLGYTVQQPKK